MWGKTVSVFFFLLGLGTGVLYYGVNTLQDYFLCE
jgi:hypothetical protein